MDVFVGRQPILTLDLQIWAYELLFRSGRENVFPDFDPDGATAHILNNTVCVFGQNSLTGGRPAFINCTRRVLCDELYTILPRESVVLELLETVELDSDALFACKRLREAGYRLALDDFVDCPQIRPFVELAEFIKVDFRASDPSERARIASELGGSLELIAEKIESQSEADEAERLGFSYLQGFFYCKPELITRSNLAGQQATYLQLMQELWRPELDGKRIAEVVSRDPALSMNLLRLANSVGLGAQVPTQSISHAILRVGENMLRQWGTVLSLCGISSHRPDILLRTCLLRARLCEALANASGQQREAPRAFLVGMLSLLDVLTGRPREELCRELGIDPQLERALADPRSELGRFLELAIAMDRVDQERIALLAEEVGLSADSLIRAYADAVHWIGEILEQSARPR